MSYEYKTIMKREGFDFDMHKNKWNSRLSYVSALSNEDHNVMFAAAMINNKTGVYDIFDEAKDKFSKKTIADLEKKIKSIYSIH